jgi:hypothetical protein
MVLLDDPTEMTQDLIFSRNRACREFGHITRSCRLALIQSMQSMLNAAQSHRFRLGNQHLKQDLERLDGFFEVAH